MQVKATNLGTPRHAISLQLLRAAQELVLSVGVVVDIVGVIGLLPFQQSLHRWSLIGVHLLFLMQALESVGGAVNACTHQFWLRVPILHCVAFCIPDFFDDVTTMLARVHLIRRWRLII